ncbi:hypothetical protein K503DRAFT_805557 [Rhizopogon vinicolor AM-OR11-026]|uniref:Mid2 domain-containing protein n=1 Tax=Rhizopogon vinicolor AM-OR11-026 TaxID=1314800 RepID=A0A1B7MHI2_9AGAM|nr:hypothetical protein K503DRAFT_805557 [Rhizopogon vinicolor AM-OR11-026]
MLKSLLLRMLCITSVPSVVRAFSVTVGTPTQCDNLVVSWTGGQAPFQILLTPFASPMRNFSVPASAFSNGKGSYSITELPFKTGTQFLLVMSDATGFASGGTTTILTVGSPVANNDCVTGPGVPEFDFSTPLQLSQCAEYEFTDFGTAVLPATITGLIPGGEYMVFNVTGPIYTWIADVVEGTNIAWIMIDSLGNQGGVSPLTTVLSSSNTSCLNDNSPSSTTSAPSQMSGQSTPQTTSQAPSQTQSPSKPTNVGVIAGATVGGVALLIIAGICCRRKASRQSRRKDDDHDVKQNFPSQYQTDHTSLPLPMQHGSQSLANVSASDPFIQHFRQPSSTDSYAGELSISSSSRLMGAMGGGQNASPNTFAHQTLPVGLSPPIHPGSYSHQTNISPASGNFAFNDPNAPFSQYAPMTGQTTPQSYTFPSHYSSASNYTVSDTPSPLPTLASRMSSNIDGGSSSSGGRMAAAAGQPQVIMHTDIEDVRAPSSTQDVIELPPQYTDRQLPDSQPASTPNQKTPIVCAPPPS